MAKKASARDMGSASVWIYPEHADLANQMRGEGGQGKNLWAAAGLGLFKLQLDSYVFAASIGLALQEATPEDQMPKDKKDTKAGFREIHESTVLGHDGAKKLAILVGLLTHRNHPEIYETDDDAERLEIQINQLTAQVKDAKTAWVERFALLDRYAHRGFEWLLFKKESEISMEDLIFKAITEIEAKQYGPEDSPETKDIFQRKLDSLT